ncbi:MAG: serine hydrolase [Bacteroidota bacterium]
MKKLLFLILLLNVLLCRAQNKKDLSPPLTVIDAWIDAQKDYQDIPGISAGIVIDQELIWSKGYGFSDVSLKTKTTDSTIYSICSISKLFTAISIMQLRDQGKLDLDDEIGQHLPWFNLQQQFPESGPITIRSLLTHSSGVPRDSDFPYWADPKFPFPTDKQFRKKLSGQKTLYPASTIYQYSNLGMSLLGKVVSELSGISYEEYVYENILKPLGLKDTKPIMPDIKNARLAKGYSVISRDRKREELNHFQAKSITPAAGFSSTVKDLAAFASWHFKIREEIDNTVLNGNTLKEMQRVHWYEPGYSTTRGLGFGVYKKENVTLIGHAGECPGYLTSIKMVKDKKWAFIVMINSLGVNYTNFIMSMYNIMNNYKNAQSVKTPNDLNLEDYSGKYYDLWDGDNLIIPWKGRLAIFSLKSKSLNGPHTIAKHIEGDKFKCVRQDGNLGADIKFERDKNGKVIKYWIHSFYMEKIDANE